MVRILVVDDDEQILIIRASTYSKDAHELITAENGVAAIRLQMKNPADAVILNIIMPDKEGPEAVIEFRHDYLKTKIIAISGGGPLGPENYLALASMMGVDLIFEKPFSLPHFREAARRLIARQAALHDATHSCSK